MRRLQFAQPLVEVTVHFILGVLWLGELFFCYAHFVGCSFRFKKLWVHGLRKPVVARTVDC